MAHPGRVADLGRRLAEILARSWAVAEVSIRDLSRLTGGASRETWAFTACVGRGEEVGLILRLTASSDGRAAPLSVEAAAMRSAGDAGVPVPVVHGVGLDDVLGDYMIMQRCEGATIPRRILRDPDLADVRRGLARRLGEIAARIHSAAPPRQELMLVDRPVETLVDDLGRGVSAPPGLALGIRWLHENEPAARSPRFVHGDLRLGNVMIARQGITAMLDWELSHLGNPVEDLGWLCAKVWRFGSTQPVAGVGTREDLLDGYESVAGWRPTESELDWWELFATVRWGLMCGVMADRHLSGHKRSVELVAIGRRAAEQEHDVLLTLGYGEDQAGSQKATEPAGAVADVYGSPTADELLAGIHDYLVTGPMVHGGALGYHARVAANLVEVIRREQALGTEARRAHQAGLASFGCRDDQELSKAILDGTLDSRWEEVCRFVQESVRSRLAVANPRHLQTAQL